MADSKRPKNHSRIIQRRSGINQHHTTRNCLEKGPHRREEGNHRAVFCENTFLIVFFQEDKLDDQNKGLFRKYPKLRVPAIIRIWAVTDCWDMR